MDFIYKRVGGVLVVYLALLAAAGFIGTAHASDSWSWVDDRPVVDYITDVDSTFQQSNICYLANGPSAEVSVKQVKGTQVAGNFETNCMIANGDNLALYSYVEAGRNLAVQFAGDSYPRAIRGITCNRTCVYMPSRDMLLVRETLSDAYIGKIAIYKDFIRNLEHRHGDPLTFDDNYYQFTQAAPDEYLNDFFDEAGSVGYTSRFVKSRNDKWLVTEVAGSGLYRIDMDTREMVKFSNWQVPNQSPSLRIEFDITDDGRYAYASQFHAKYSVYEVKDDCGILLPSSPSGHDMQMYANCPVAQLGAALQDILPENYLFSTMYQFSRDGSSMSFYLATGASSIPQYQVTLRPAGYNSKQLDYLALGDSYASGEGDTEKTSEGGRYYRPLTDTYGHNGTPKERCHISTRSYPYRLAIGMNIGEGDWNTIACSGATAWDVKAQGAAAYLGQSDRLKGFDDVYMLKYQALNEFIPGRQKQIEFVRKYKPKTITLTMGGNDIGFGDKLTDCVASITTCDYVGAKRNDIASAIARQYTNLKSLYEELYRASGAQAKIYVVGYPNFINGSGDAKCGWNVGSLRGDARERELIANSVTYLNNVIRQAARAAGVKYVDVQDSLNGHRLCDSGAKYVTGLTDILDTGDNRQESFHPNADGHAMIAHRIWGNLWSEELGAGESLLDYDICPNTTRNICPDATATKEKIAIPEYFAGVDSKKNIETKRMTASVQKKKTIFDIILAQFTFLPKSLVNIAFHSDPINLGQYAVDDDGSFEVSLEVPQELPAGFHTLVLTGYTYSGEPIEYEQTILIKGLDDNDVDENGVDDRDDACLFVPASGVDVDQDGIDDACDPTIIEPPDVTPSPSPSVTPSPTTTPTSNPGSGQGLGFLAGLIKQIIDVVVQVVSAVVGVLQSVLKFKFW